MWKDDVGEKSFRSSNLVKILIDRYGTIIACSWIQEYYGKLLFYFSIKKI